jgi:hypothetical protein
MRLQAVINLSVMKLKLGKYYIKTAAWTGISYEYGLIYRAVLA